MKPFRSSPLSPYRFSVAGRLPALLTALLLLLGGAVCLGQSQEVAEPAIKTIHPTFTTIDVPGAGYTGLWGINKTGEMVGNYGENIDADSGGFTYFNGVFAYFNYPGETVTVPEGINDSGLIVGSAGQDPVVGFLYDGTNFTTITDGTGGGTFARGINDAGVIVGGAGTIYTTKGFELRNSRFKTIEFPGLYTYGFAQSINNLGTIAGYTVDGTSQYGYVVKNGKFQNVDVPGAVETDAMGINDGGLIVGWYAVPQGCVCAFAMKNGKYLSFSYPGAAGTFADGVNASGQIVGEYTSDYRVYHGFVTSPITDADLR